MKQKSRTTYSLMNMGAGLAGYFINTLVGFVCRMVFVRSLPPEYLGINGLFSNILSMLSLAELGIGSAIIFALYRPLAENDERKIASIMQFYASAYRIIGCVIAVIGIALIPFLKYIIGETPQIKENINLIYLVFLFNTCITYFFSYRGSLILASQRNYILLTTSYVITILQSILQIGVLLIWHEYMLYLAIQTIGAITYNILISQKAVKDYPYIKEKGIEPLPKDEKKSLFKNIRALTFNKLAMVLVNSSDNIIITFFSGLVIVGYTSNYVLFSGIIDTLTKQIFDGLTASVGNLNAIEDREKSYRFFNIFQFASYAIFGWMSIGIWLVSSDLVALCFGDSFVLPPEIPFILGINFYILKMTTAANTYRETLGLFKYGQFTLFFTAILNIGLSILFGRLWGVFGILLATSVARLLTNVWYIPYAVFKHGLNKNPILYFVSYVKYLVLVIITGALCFFVCHFITIGAFWNVLLKIIVCSIIPILVVTLFFHKTFEYQYLLDKVKTYASKVKNTISRRKGKEQ